MPGRRAAGGRADRPGESGGAAHPSLPPRTGSVLEVRVFPGSIEVNEFYSEGQAEALARALAAYGVRTSRRFASRCG